MKSRVCSCCLAMVLAWAMACGGNDTQGPTFDSITTDVPTAESVNDDVPVTPDTPRDEATGVDVKPDTVEATDTPPVETDTPETAEAEVAPVCQTAADCDDGDPCTTDACDTAADKCTHTAVNGCTACKLD